jgi:hypothetical protein
VDSGGFTNLLPPYKGELKGDFPLPLKKKGAK